MKKYTQIVFLSFLILGNMVGAGILGLPSVGIAGFIPIALALIIYSVAMCCTALILSNENIETQNEIFNYPTLYRKYLGSAGKWVAIIANLLIFYGTLVAYIAGGTEIIVKLFHLQINNKIVLILFFLLLTSLTLSGFNFIGKFISATVILKWITFLLIVIIGIKYLNADNLSTINWTLTPLALPVIAQVFNFHNIIPNVCKSTGWNPSVIYKAILAGVIMGLIMNLLWLLVGMGVIPLNNGENSIIYSYIHNIPVTVPLAAIIQWKYFTLFILIFSMIGMFTSYMTQGIGLLWFSRDLLINHIKFKRSINLLNIFITFGPPLIISFINPNIFIKILGISGAYGIAVLFGILPGIIVVMKPQSKLYVKVIGYVLIVLFSFAVITQALIDLNIIHAIIPK